jgi:hypothetical protein
MSATPTKKIGPDRDNPDGRNHIIAPANHSHDGEDVCCFAVGGGT